MFFIQTVSGFNFSIEYLFEIIFSLTNGDKLNNISKLKIKREKLLICNDKDKKEKCIYSALENNLVWWLWSG